MAYFGGGAGSLQALLLAEVEVSEEEEGMDVLLIIRSLMRAFRSAICGINMIGMIRVVL